jgi:hypothetical protein
MVLLMAKLTRKEVIFALGWVAGGNSDIEDILHKLGSHPTFADEFVAGVEVANSNFAQEARGEES